MSISNSSKNAKYHLLSTDTLYPENYEIEARKLQAREVAKLAKAFIQILKKGYSTLINAGRKSLETHHNKDIQNATGSTVNITGTTFHVP